MPDLLRLLRRGPGGGVWLLAGVFGWWVGCATVGPQRPPASDARPAVMQTAPPIAPQTVVQLGALSPAQTDPVRQPATGAQANGPSASQDRADLAPPSTESGTPVGAEPHAANAPESTSAQGPESKATQGRESTSAQGPESKATQRREPTSAQGPESKATQGQESKATQGQESKATQGQESTSAQGPESKATQGQESTCAQGPEAKATQGAESSAAQGTASRPVTLAFVGDILFGHFHSRGYARHHRPDQQPLSAVSALLAADLSIANLETPIVSTLPARSPVNSKYRFGAAAGALAILRQAGIGAVSVANNHAADLKEAGLHQTPALLRAQGITPLGEARLPAESSPFVVKTLQVGGLRLGIVAATTQLNVPLPLRESTPRLPVCDTALLPQRIVPLLRQARADHDVLAVLLHWGNQFTDLPSPTQRRVAHALIDAGADLVIGHHPHVLQGLEQYRRGLIAYSLGNFLFPDSSGAPRLTGVLRVQLARDPVAIDRVEFLPAVARSVAPAGVAPQPAQGRAAVEVLGRLRSVSAPLGTRLQVLSDRAQLPIAPPPIAPPPIAPPNQVPPPSPPSPPLALSPQ